MRVGDLPGVLAVQRQAYGDAFQEECAVFEAKLRLAPDAAWLAEQDGAAVAYLFAHPWSGCLPPALNVPLAMLPGEADCAYLHDLAVAPQARGSGVASKLIESFSRWAGATGFERSMLVAVGDAQEFWARLGFEPLEAGEALRGRLAAYGARAACMQRDLSGVSLKS